VGRGSQFHFAVPIFKTEAPAASSTDGARPAAS